MTKEENGFIYPIIARGRYELRSAGVRSTTPAISLRSDFYLRKFKKEVMFKMKTVCLQTE